MGEVTEAKTRALKKPCRFTSPCVRDRDQELTSVLQEGRNEGRGEGERGVETERIRKFEGR